jgi:hypothetical protein
MLSPGVTRLEVHGVFRATQNISMLWEPNIQGKQNVDRPKVAEVDPSQGLNRCLVLTVQQKQSKPQMGLHIL